MAAYHGGTQSEQSMNFLTMLLDLDEEIKIVGILAIVVPVRTTVGNEVEIRNQSARRFPVPVPEVWER